MTAPNTREWQAIENRQPPMDRQAVPFYVTGEVETTNSALQPVLRPAVPQGINPKILILNLTIESAGGIGTTDVNYRPVRYDDKVAQGQYTDVSIHFEGDVVASIKVQVVH